MDDNKRELLGDNYPSNRRTEKRETAEKKIPEDKKVEKVVNGKVRKQKRSLRKKMAETFLEDDTKSVGSYVFHDILIPAAKDLISDIVGGGVEMLLFGERRSGSRSRGSSIRPNNNRSFTSYGSYYGPSNKDNRPAGRDMSRTARARHDFDEIILDTRGEAEEVLSHLVDLTVDYGQASVSDLYDLVGVTSAFTDEKYGWTDLRGASISRARGGGYLLNLPRTQALD